MLRDTLPRPLSFHWRLATVARQLCGCPGRGRDPLWEPSHEHWPAAIPHNLPARGPQVKWPTLRLNDVDFHRTDKNCSKDLGASSWPATFPYGPPHTISTSTISWASASALCKTGLVSLPGHDRYKGSSPSLPHYPEHTKLLVLLRPTSSTHGCSCLLSPCT